MYTQFAQPSYYSFLIMLLVLQLGLPLLPYSSKAHNATFHRGANLAIIIIGAASLDTPWLVAHIDQA
jgi:hypothetical protein